MLSSFFDIISELLKFKVSENCKSVTLFWGKFKGSNKFPKKPKNAKTVSKQNTTRNYLLIESIDLVLSIS